MVWIQGGGGRGVKEVSFRGLSCIFQLFYNSEDGGDGGGCTGDMDHP